MNLLAGDLLVFWYLHNFIEQTKKGVHTFSFAELSEHEISICYSLVRLQVSQLLQTKRLEFHHSPPASLENPISSSPITMKF